MILIPEKVRKDQMILVQKRSLRAKAETKKKNAHEKMQIGDLQGAKQDLRDARLFIQEALQKVRKLGERGKSERTIQDDIEALWRRITTQENDSV